MNFFKTKWKIIFHIELLISSLQLFFYLQNFYKRSVVVVEPFSLELLKNHVKSDNVLDCNEFPKTKFAPDEVLSHHHMTSHSHDIS
jgi:hypothetical protein